jgi:polyhydroxyalkanoate synthesis regulator phasin
MPAPKSSSSSSRAGGSTRKPAAAKAAPAKPAAAKPAAKAATKAPAKTARAKPAAKAAPKPAAKTTAAKTTAAKTTAAKTTAAKATAAKTTAAKTTAAKTTAAKAAKPAASKPTAAKAATTKAAAAKPAATKPAAKATSKANARNPRDVAVLTRDRIQAVLDDAVDRGRVTRKDANDLVDKLHKHGRKQADEFISELERRVEQGRKQLTTATRKARRAEPVDRIVRTADRARRTVGVGPSFPILGYDELTAGQVNGRIAELKPADLRKVREYERKHANRKSVLDALEKALA